MATRTTTLSHLAGVVEGAWIEGPPATEVSGITCDSRQVSPGDVMVCIRGTRMDGHDHAADAVRRGAAALVVERRLPGLEGAPTVIVPDARRALGPMADRLHDHPSGRLDVVGVTGTDGKTSIVNLAGSVAERAGHRPGVIGTLGIGRPGASESSVNTTPGADLFQSTLATMVEGGASAAFAEVSSHALDMHRTRGTEFRVVVLSNLSRDHLDWHGSWEAYRESKSRLFRRSEWGVDPAADTGRASLAVLPGDDPSVDYFASRSDLPVVRFGFSEGVEWRITEPHLTPRRSRARLAGRERSIDIDVPIPGRFSLLNAAAAAVACDFLGIAPGEITDGLSRIGSIAGRMEPVDLGQPFAVLVDYAHTPEALRAVLGTVREFTSGRVICVVGCGGDRDPGKRPLMAQVAAAASDFLVLTSDNPRSEDPETILDAMERGLVGAATRWARVTDRANAVMLAVGEARPGDTVVIAGKGHERYQEIAGERRPCDDRVLSARSLAALGYDRSKGTDS